MKRPNKQETEVLSFRVPKGTLAKVDRQALKRKTKRAHLAAELFMPVFEELIRPKQTA